MKKFEVALIIIVLCLAVTSVSIGTAYSAWVLDEPTSVDKDVQFKVDSWSFNDTDFALYDNVSSSTNLTITKETTLTQNSAEAIRATSTTGTSTKDHFINISFDRDYYMSEIWYYKFEFDYHHRYKREQYNKGFPTVQFLVGNSTFGSGQGGTDSCTSKSAFVATPIDENWWHLEYYIFAHAPVLSNHGDSPIPLTKKINGVRINDRTMYDYNGTTAYVVIDNMKFSAEPTSRLGVFNRWTSDTAGKYFWFKVAFAGELHSVKLYSSDTSVAVPEFNPSDTVSTTAPFPNGSPFYFYLIAAGTVTFTAELELGDDHRILSISNTLTVT
ncbi:MAG: hypothetical protein J6W64_04000 [Bacilli bacterium]|nr:hypothetical protein [Bacilli bacterium]